MPFIGTDLGEEFDAVILASCLINIPDDGLRALQLAKCRTHLQSGSPLLFERHDPAWLSTVTVGYLGDIGTIGMYIDEAARKAADAELCCRYQEGDQSWSHRFTARILDDAAPTVRFCDDGLLIQWDGLASGVASAPREERDR